jgi:hypothetical protein
MGCRDREETFRWGADWFTVGPMAAADDDPLPRPEPKEIDEKKALELRHMMEDATLKGVPYGEEKCGNCMYYLDPDAKLAYCWHPKLRILVGTEWWCQWWEAIPED